MRIQTAFTCNSHEVKRSQVRLSRDSDLLKIENTEKKMKVLCEKKKNHRNNKAAL